jgi:hypothetical protein
VTLTYYQLMVKTMVVSTFHNLVDHIFYKKFSRITWTNSTIYDVRLSMSRHFTISWLAWTAIIYYREVEDSRTGH